MMISTTTWLLVACGGATGALLRLSLSLYLQDSIYKSFPVIILVINIIGCLVMGCFYSLTQTVYSDLPESLRLGFSVGFLGSFTTFSAFSLDTIVLFQHGDYLKALLNIAMSLVLCLMATYIGILLTLKLTTMK
ncbi:MAG: fluoride efflux transporter CrcB [Pseudomonadota bacterium]